MPRFLFTAVALCATFALSSSAGFCQVRLAPPAPPTTTPTPRQVRFDGQITRTETAPAKPQPATSDPAKPDAPKTEPAPPLNTPVLLGSPTITTLDRNTASIALTGGDTSYTLALSPTIESADNAVQVLWNLRMNGKDFPGGTASFTLTGATRIVAGVDTPLAEMTLSDPKTGQAATFRVRIRVSVSSATPAPVAAP